MHKSRIANHESRRVLREGWKGWDEYAPFYDWENAQTFGRRDVKFWTRFAQRAGGRVLELGCGTGRILRPLARAGIDVIGIDRSAQMLTRATRPLGRRPGGALRVVRGDIRVLPFPDRSFSAVLAPYGILQSLTRSHDLRTTLAAVARVIETGGTFGVDLVPDVPNWREYTNRTQLRGRAGAVHLTLVETVRQDPRRRLTTFEQCYIERQGRRTKAHRFELTFRTLGVQQTAEALVRAGFEVTAILGDYNGRPWDERADVWIILAKRG